MPATPKMPCSSRTATTPLSSPPTTRSSFSAASLLCGARPASTWRRTSSSACSRSSRSGKRYRVPYRVVVHKVVGWTIKEHFQGLPTDVPLPEDWDLADEADPYRSLEDDEALGDLFAELPERTRRVLELRYIARGSRSTRLPSAWT